MLCISYNGVSRNLPEVVDWVNQVVATSLMRTLVQGKLAGNVGP